MKSFTPWEHLRLYRAYLRDYPRVARFPGLTPAEISGIQLGQVRAMVDLAYHRTAFYRTLYSRHDIHPNDITSWADFGKLPTIGKRDVMENYADFIVDGRVGRSPRISRSSGSSGQVLTLVGDTGHWINSTLVMIRTLQESFGFRPFRDRFGVTIYTSRFPSQAWWGVYSAYYLNTLTPPEELIRRIVRVKPPYIISYPSILLELVTQYPDRCRSLKLKGISTNSEQSSQEQRDIVADVFGCRVFDEYSTEELREVGFQCYNRAYHLQEDSAYVEILDPDEDRAAPAGAVGEIVGTCLSNRLMPFIRYRQGDLGSVRASDCDCGNNGRILADISGRKNSSFRLADGRTVPSGRILDWTYKLVLRLGVPIHQFQVTQHTLNGIEVVVVAGDGYAPATHDEVIARSFRDEFGDFLEVDVRRVDAIERTPAGKHIPIRSLLP